MLVFDTNVLIYAADEASEFHHSCRQRLEEARRDASPSFLTWNVCYEFLRVTTHHRVLRSPLVHAKPGALSSACWRRPDFFFLPPPSVTRLCWPKLSPSCRT